MRSTPRQRAATLLLTATLIAAAAGCGDDDPGLPEPPDRVTAPEPTVIPSPDPIFTEAETEAANEAWAAYDGFMVTYVELATAGSLPAAETELTLLLYAEQAVAVDARNEVLQRHLDGEVASGDLGWTLVDIMEVDLEPDGDSAVPRVVLGICHNGADWQIVDLDTGEPAGEPAGRYLSTVSFEWREEREFGPSGWAVHEREDGEVGSC